MHFSKHAFLDYFLQQEQIQRVYPVSLVCSIVTLYNTTAVQYYSLLYSELLLWTGNAAQFVSNDLVELIKLMV